MVANPVFCHTPNAILVRDDEGVYAIDREDLIKYSGRAGLIVSCDKPVISMAGRIAKKL